MKFAPITLVITALGAVGVTGLLEIARDGQGELPAGGPEAVDQIRQRRDRMAPLANHDHGQRPGDPGVQGLRE